MPLFCKYGCGDADIYVWQVAETVEELLLMVDDATRAAATNLNSLEFLTIWNAATDFVDNFTECCTHWNFNKTCIVDFTTKSKYFCTL